MFWERRQRLAVGEAAAICAAKKAPRHCKSPSPLDSMDTYII